MSFQCSNKCGAGIQTRTVFCATSSDDGLTKVDDTNCDPEKKYESEQVCHAQNENCLGNWFSGPWSEVRYFQLSFYL
jgi:hypothetical protein